jgi:glycosyltransferase involved in cell wall biosynthesis
MKIGHVHSGYPEVRNIFSVLSKKISHIKCIDIFKLRDFIHFKLFNNNNYYLHNSFNDKFSFPKADVYHFFNGINYGDKPWVCTFEGFLPRYGNNKVHEKKAIEAMAKPNCKKLIAFSQFNYNIQLDFIKSSYPYVYDIIKEKSCVIYPPQAILKPFNFSKFDNINTLKLLFVGREFFKKSGREVFNVVERLVTKGFDIELTIVSKLSTDDFISNTSKEDSRAWVEKIKCAPFCNYHESLSNEKVLQLMSTSHVFVFPSLQDTFGYVVLEAQAFGTPVISTNIRALSEINNERCGWLIDLPQTEKGFADVYTNGYAPISSIIEHKLEKILSSILNDTSILKQKAKKSTERIQNSHCVEKFSEKILSIYKDTI